MHAMEMPAAAVRALRHAPADPFRHESAHRQENDFGPIAAGAPGADSVFAGLYDDVPRTAPTTDIMERIGGTAPRFPVEEPVPVGELSTVGHS